MSSKNTQSDLIKNYVAACTPFIKRPLIKQKDILFRLAEKLELMLPKNRKYSKVEEFYCYIYLDPRYLATYKGEYSYNLPSGKLVTFTHRPFYIGKGKGFRMRGHLSEAKDKNKNYKNNYKTNIINKLYKLGLEPIIKVTKSKANESLALAYEADLIAGIGRKNDNFSGPLSNVTHGGEGVGGTIYTKAELKISNNKRKITNNSKTLEEKQITINKMQNVHLIRTVEENKDIENKKAASREVRSNKTIKKYASDRKNQWSNRTLEERQESVNKRLDTIKKKKEKLPINKQNDIEYFEY